MGKKQGTRRPAGAAKLTPALIKQLLTAAQYIHQHGSPDVVAQIRKSVLPLTHDEYQDQRQVFAELLKQAKPEPAGRDYLVVLIPVCGAFLQVAVHMPSGRVLYHSDGTQAWEEAQVQGRVAQLPS